jgi:hypothetical protein
VGYAVDDGITEPMIRQYYEWHLLDPEIPDDEKGDYEIHAHGSTALVERSIQDQSIMEMSQLALNPAYGVDPKRWFAQMSKSKHLDPRDFQYTDEEMKRMEETPPPPPPQVQAAQIRAQLEQLKLQASQQADAADQQLARELAQLDAQVKQNIAAQDTDRDLKWVEANNAQTQIEKDFRLQELILKRDLAIMEYSNKRGIAIEEVKAKLAMEAMKLKVTKELAELDARKDGVKLPKPPSTPPIEPAGRAEDGQSYAQ